MSVTNAQVDEAIVDMAGVDYLDLWSIARMLECEFGDALGGDARDIALGAVERLLRAGTLRAGELVPPGEFEPWCDDAEDSIRVVRERAAGLGRAPSVGEIGWFELVD
jgi:hypothetical protein